MIQDLLRKVKPGEPISAAQYNELIRLASGGQLGRETFSDATGTYTRPSPKGSIVLMRVELKTELVPSNDDTPTEATAHPLDDDGDGTYTPNTASGAEITVIDPTGFRRGRAKHASGRGSYGIVSQLPDTHGSKWEIIALEEIATHCAADFVFAITGNGTASVDHIEPMDGLSPVNSDTSSLTARVARSTFGPANTECRLVWSFDAVAGGQYEIVWADSPATNIEFTLTATLALTDADTDTDDATVTNYWGGADPGSAVKLYNKSISTNYMFEGVTGAEGIAVYDDLEDKYRIIQLECP